MNTKSSARNRHRLFIGLIVGVLGFAAAGCGAPGSQADGTGSRFEKLVVVGDPVSNGIFDGSVEYGPDGTGWLAYSRVALPKYVSTHLAKSRDHGRTWTYVATIGSCRNPDSGR